MIQSVLRTLRNGLLRIWLLYALTFAGVFFMLNYKEAKMHSYAATLSRLQPPYEYLTQYNDGKVSYDRKELLAYRLFFSQLVRILPNRADGYAMLGFCQHELGETRLAIDSYKKAADQVPPFLWFNYNLGFVYFEVKDYSNAITYLNRAIQSNPEISFKYIVTSKPYLDAIATVPGFQDQFLNRFRGALRDSYKLLVLSYFHAQQLQGLVVSAQSAINEKLDDDGFFHYYLGVAAYYSRQLEAAVMYFQKSIALNAQAPEAYQFLGLVLKDLGKPEMAAAVMKQAQMYAQTKGPQFELLKKIRLRIF